MRGEDVADKDGKTSALDKAAKDRDAAQSISNAPLKEVPKTDFELLVEHTLGRDLPVFGKTLFDSNSKSDFVSGSGGAAPADYLVGPGDQLRVRTWGKVDIDVKVTVDAGGQIFLPQVGTISVAGVRVDQLDDYLRNAIGQQFKGFNLSVTLGQLRSIQVFVLGQALHPGVYTVSSLSTLVNALFASGGPNAAGTLRDIQVKREGKVITHFDVYGLLLNGDKSADTHLLPGDIIFIPQIGPQIAIDGTVTMPGIYELKGPSTVASVLQTAGGLTAVAGTARVSVDRIEDHSRRTVGELALNGREQTVLVNGGDILRFYPVSSKIENAVTLRGTVGNPGRYPYHPGMRVSDLIPTRQFLLTRSYYNRLNLLDQTNLRDPFSDAGNKGSSTSTESVTDAKAAAAATTSKIDTGAGSSEDPEGDKLASHDTEINWNYALIERLGQTDLQTHLVPFALGEAIDNPASPENKELQPGDVVVVYARKDINLPSELRARFVRIDGEVRAPGVYRVEESETLRDLVRRAGGLAPHSYLYAAQFTRASVKLAQEAKLKDIVQRESLEALSPINSTSRGSISAAASGQTELELRKAYLAELAKVEATGRVVLQIKPDANTLEDIPTFSLQDGDHFFVPAVPNTVDVLGSVFNQGSLRFVDGHRAKDYLNAAGGSTREGDQSHEFILRADGSLVSRQRVHGFAGLHIYPGDTVVVPGRYKLPFSITDLTGFTQSLSTFALTAVALKSLQ